VKGKSPCAASSLLAGWLPGDAAGLGTVMCIALAEPFAQRFLPVSERLCNFRLRKILGEHLSPER